MFAAKRRGSAPQTRKKAAAITLTVTAELKRKAARLLSVPLVLTVIACQYIGARPSAEPSRALGTPTPSPVVSPSYEAPPTLPPSPPPTPTASLSPSEAYDATLHQQAQEYLARWAEIAAGAAPNAVVLVGELTRGGGWHGPNADNAKSAFLSGLIEATVELPTQAPSPGEVVWPDGSTATVSLFSAAEALDDLISQTGEGECSGCQAVKVTGAKLVTGEAETSRGPATVPLWQFEFAAEDAPRTPITHVAVRDRIIAPPEPPWDPYGGNPTGDRIDAAYGTPQDSELTVVFVGAALPGDQWCGADYTGEGVESDLAVVVIIHGQSHPPSGLKPGGCWALGATRTALVKLGSSLGNRTVLEVQFGTPVTLRSGEPPQDEISN